MRTIDFTIDNKDLEILFLHTRHAYGNCTFQSWLSQVKLAYSNFIKNKTNPKSFTDWVNGQIIYLTS